PSRTTSTWFANRCSLSAASVSSTSLALSSASRMRLSIVSTSPFLPTAPAATGGVERRIARQQIAAHAGLGVHDQRQRRLQIGPRALAVNRGALRAFVAHECRVYQDRRDEQT